MDNTKNIIIGKSNINNCLIDVTFTHVVNTSKNQADKEDKDIEPAKTTVSIQLKGELSGILSRLTSGKPVIDWQTKARSNWNKHDITPPSNTTIIYGATSVKVDLIGKIKDDTKDMNQEQKIKYLRELGIDI